MSVLRTPVRRTKAFGAQIPAVVEEVNLGLTTVRLATNGARLTNLPTLGNVAPGDLVTVDYATGTPYVRQTTVPEVEPTVVLPLAPATAPDPDMPAKTGNPAVAAVKLEGSAQAAQEYIFNGSFWEWDLKKVTFGTPIFDPDGLSNGSGITFRQAGMYFWYAVIASGITPYTGSTVEWPSFDAVPNIISSTGTNYVLSGWKYVRAYSGNAVIVNISGLYPFYANERLAICTKMYDYEGAGQLIHSTKLYPIIGAWRINALKYTRRTTA